jgi:hypothetical protein
MAFPTSPLTALLPNLVVAMGVFNAGFGVFNYGPLPLDYIIIYIPIYIEYGVTTTRLVLPLFVACSTGVSFKFSICVLRLLVLASALH